MTTLRIAEIMARYVEFADPEMTATDAAALMGDLDVGCLPIGTPQSVEGIVTDRDLLYRVIAAGLHPSIPLRQVMSHPVITCNEADTVQTVLDAMANHHIRRMPVLDESAQVSGWITLADLSRKLLIDNNTLQSTLRTLTEPA